MHKNAIGIFSTTKLLFCSCPKNYIIFIYNFYDFIIVKKLYIPFFRLENILFCILKTKHLYRHKLKIILAEVDTSSKVFLQKQWQGDGTISDYVWGYKGEYNTKSIVKMVKTAKKTVKKAKIVKKAKTATPKAKIKPKSVKKSDVKEETSEVVLDEPKPPKKKSTTQKKIDDTVFAVAGENGVNIIKFLGDKSNISEFIIADKLKLDMQTVRNTLYKLHTHNVATYIRKKDRQKGWYISYWTFNKKRINDLVEVMKKMQIDKLKERLAKEEASRGVFFICTKACARLDFYQATEFEFKCPECGSLMQQQENLRTIEHLRERIEELQSSI